MQKTLLLLTVFLVSVYLAVESAASSLGSLEYDNFDTNLADLNEVEEVDLDEFFKLLDNADKVGDDRKIKNSGFKKKTTSNRGSKSNHNIGDLKKFYKTTGIHDQGANDDEEVYAQAKGFSGTAVGIKGSEDRKYRKGTKTRGFHRVHNKDEYKKDKVFYKDDETSGTVKKVGAKRHGYKIKAGAGLNIGRFHQDRQKGLFGKRGYTDKGLSDKEFSDFTDSQGFEGSFSYES